MSDFSFVALGVGDAFSALYYSSCLLLSAEGRHLLVDCPHPIRKILKESAQLDLMAIEAVVLTHLHADHSSGLEGYGYFSFFALREKARLITHPDVSERLWAGHLAAGMERLMRAPDYHVEEKLFQDYFECIALSEQEPLQFGPFRIECRKTIHHIPTTALKIRAAGKTLAYSADTAFDPSLIDWMSSADLIIHETNYGAHTPYEKLADLPEQLRAKMRLIHYPDNFNLTESMIQPLTQGQRHAV